MRTPLLLTLLLLGCLQAAIAPVTSPVQVERSLQLRGGPVEAPPAPADNTTTLKRLNDTSRQSALTGDGKLQKGILAGALHHVPAADAASSRMDVAGPSTAESIHQRPPKPRAPPFAPSC
ncbi:MAG: hypothetical protein IPG61_07285 [bacterium]|nr:hypothetical protein [bacterium]